MVENDTSLVSYDLTSSTGPFAIPFYFLENDHIQAQLYTLASSGEYVETTLTLNSDYTLTGAGNKDGGQLTLTASHSGSKLYILRDPDDLQQTSYVATGKFPATSHERALDKLTMLIQLFGWLWDNLAPKKPNILAKYYDVKSNRIANLGNPVNTQDATPKMYVDTADQAESAARAAGDASVLSQANANQNKTIRVPETAVQALVTAAGRAKSLLGFNSSGQPVPIFTMTDTADLAIKLAGHAADGEGGGLVGYDISNDYLASTIGKKLNLMLSPYDFGAIADGTLHPLSEFFSTLAAAQAVYSFATDLTQSIDWAAMQKCINEVISRGCAGMTLGMRGNYYLNDMAEFNKTGSNNTANKLFEANGSLITSAFGRLIANFSTAATFGTWTLSGGVTVDGDGLRFAGDTSTLSKATVTLNGLTVGKLYAVSIYCEEFTSASNSYIGAFVTGIGRIMIAGDSGPGTYHAEFIATAATMSMYLQDDTYTTLPIACKIYRVDVRLASYALRFYQTGTAISHGSMLIHGLKMVGLSTVDSFGGVRCDTMNHSFFAGMPQFDTFPNGPGIHYCNLVSWSENNRIDTIKCSGTREPYRFSRPARGSGTSSFARTRVGNTITAGGRYAWFYADHATSVYDSNLGKVSGNLTSTLRAICGQHGDMTNTVLESIDVESNSAPSSAGVYEFGTNDLRRAWLGNIGAYVNLKQLYATGSFSSTNLSSFSIKNIQTPIDFRPNTPMFEVEIMRVQSGIFGTGLSYSAGTYRWAELILECDAGETYHIGETKNIVPSHGVVEIDACMRNSDGSALQGTAFSGKYAKAAVATTDSGKVKLFEGQSIANSETIALAWGGGVAPGISFSGSTNTRSFSLYVKWTQ